MTMKFFALIAVIGFTCGCIAQAQSPTPAESPAQAATKRRAHKKAQTTASPAETAASSSAAASPAGSAKAKRTRKKAEAAATPNASASPGTFLGGLFKPKTAAAATSPAPANPAPAKGASTKAAMGPPAPGGGHGLVWVNSETHVYHKEGSRFYGTTKKGKYMTEAEAMKAGNRAASGRE
jgi:hypothetical protein